MSMSTISDPSGLDLSSGITRPPSRDRCRHTVTVTVPVTVTHHQGSLRTGPVVRHHQTALQRPLPTHSHSHSPSHSHTPSGIPPDWTCRPASPDRPPETAANTQSQSQSQSHTISDPSGLDLSSGITRPPSRDHCQHTVTVPVTVTHHQGSLRTGPVVRHHQTALQRPLPTHSHSPSHSHTPSAIPPDWTCRPASPDRPPETAANTQSQSQSQSHTIRDPSGLDLSSGITRPPSRDRCQPGLCSTHFFRTDSTLTHDNPGDSTPTQLKTQIY